MKFKLTTTYCKLAHNFSTTFTEAMASCRVRPGCGLFFRVTALLPQSVLEPKHVGQSNILSCMTCQVCISIVDFKGLRGSNRHATTSRGWHDKIEQLPLYIPIEFWLQQAASTTKLS